LKENKTKAGIYRQVFGAFLATYLVLMAGFSMFLISQEKKVKSLELNGYALHVNRMVEEVLQDNIDSNNQIKDISKVKKEFISNSTFFTLQGTETAVFTGDFTPIFNTNDYWLCSYGELGEDNKFHTVYGFLNPKDWFSEKEIEEIENYFYAQPKAEKVGDLSGYSVELEGLWVDNEMIIPEKISVIAMYANTFDENGNVISSGGEHTGDIVYFSNYKNTKGLPYFEHGSIQPNNTNRNKTNQTELRNVVLDTEKLKESVKNMPFEPVPYERVGFLTYRYYLPMPYQNTVKVTDDQTYSSEFWTVIGRDIDLGDECIGTLAFVWFSCLIIFAIVAFILAKQTFTTYQQRVELERKRQEVTNALAHDLKTPLSIISGYAQNLIENVHTEKREHYADSILANVNRMDKIIREMLELSRLESDRFQLRFEEVSLGEVAREIIKRYSNLCDEKSITTCLEGDAIVKADKSLIARVIDNFFINALDNTPEGGTIRIRIRDRFEIYNSGSYIPEDKLKDIWEPYEKVDESRSKTKSTGLGLAIAREILELHNFSYGAENIDGGVAFWFGISNTASK